MNWEHIICTSITLVDNGLPNYWMICSSVGGSIYYSSWDLPSTIIKYVTDAHIMNICLVDIVSCPNKSNKTGYSVTI